MDGAWVPVVADSDRARDVAPEEGTAKEWAEAEALAVDAAMEPVCVTVLAGICSLITKQTPPAPALEEAWGVEWVPGQCRPRHLKIPNNIVRLRPLSQRPSSTSLLWRRALRPVSDC